MATDYDAPRTRSDEPAHEPLESLETNKSAAMTALLDVEDSDTAEGIELPGADLSGEELIVKVVPQQQDEFICTSCFMVAHRSQAASSSSGGTQCRDCEAF